MSTTQTAQHTPGPWHINGGPNPTKPNYATICVKPGDHTTVDHICSIGERHSANWHANARLIAAAPELLAQLKSLLEMFDHDAAHQPDPITAGEMIDATLATIARAEGGQP